MKTAIFFAAAAASVLAVGGSAQAQAPSQVTATSDLNIRSGPGPKYDVVGVIGQDHQARLEGCLDNGDWCRVSYDGTQGCAYSRYLMTNSGGHDVALAQRPADVAVPTVTYEGGGAGAGAAVGAATGAIVGAIIGGPVGAAVGGIAGGAAGGITGHAINPPTRVRAYVRDNQVEPVYLDGEVVVGAGLPHTVKLYQIPDYEYRYVYVNREPVLVDPSNRRIVAVLR